MPIVLTEGLNSEASPTLCCPPLMVIVLFLWKLGANRLAKIESGCVVFRLTTAACF